VAVTYKTGRRAYRCLLILIIPLVVLTTTSCDKRVEFTPVEAGLTDGSPDWSPDGSTIVYCHTHISLIDGVLKPFPESSGFWFVNPDGADARMFKSHVEFMHMDWSPDGQWFAFSEDREIWKLKVTGESLTLVLSNSTGLNDSPTWSPDGKRIAFNRFQENNMTGIYTMAANGTDLRYVGLGGWASWSPDGKRIAYIGYLTIGIKDTSGMNDRTLVTTDLNAGSLVFSPDGSKIAFGATIDRIGGLYVVDTAGQNLRLLEEGACLPCWSPDGKKIVYVAKALDSVPGPNLLRTSKFLFTINADGTGRSRLTFGPSR
jgi:Tol biopolymer transport system component